MSLNDIEKRLQARRSPVAYDRLLGDLTPVIVGVLSDPEIQLYAEGRTEGQLVIALQGTIADWITRGGGESDLRESIIGYLEALKDRPSAEIRGEIRATLESIAPMPEPERAAMLRKGQYRGVPRSWPAGQKPVTHATFPPPDDPRFQRLIRDMIRDQKRQAQRQAAEQAAKRRARQTRFEVTRAPTGTVTAGPRRKRKRKRRKK